MSKGRSIQGLFNTQDLSLHRAMKRPIAGIYSMTNLVEFEPYVDSTISFFLQRLEEIQHQSQRACDLGEILQWFAFDVIGEITFSKRLGFLDKGKDVDGIIESIQRFFKYAGAVGQMPWLDRLWVQNPYISRLMPGKTSPVVLFALARARERSGLDATATTTTTSYNVNDFISRFLALRIKDPSIPEWFVTAWTTSNVMAGSDTTAIYLRAIIYFLITQPLSLARLTTELAQARRQSQLSEIVTWRECRKLPYLDACIKEAGRLHPPIGLSMERVVPAGGAEIGGKFFPAGTVVGMNPWVVHRCREVFGEDADKWRPERWLEVDGTTRASMERCLLTVSLPWIWTAPKKPLSRIVRCRCPYLSRQKHCPARNLQADPDYVCAIRGTWTRPALAIIAYLNRGLQMSQANAGWTVSNHWLAIQSDMRVHVRRHSDQVDDEQERTS